MKKRKYIIVEKRFKGQLQIERFMYLLNLIAPNRYELNTTNQLAYVENKETQMSVIAFSENPFR